MPRRAVPAESRSPLSRRTVVDLYQPDCRAPREAQPAWHALPAGRVLSALEASARGLSAAEAQARLALQFHNVLIYALLAAGAVTAALGH
jgi:hypothetical protein